MRLAPFLAVFLAASIGVEVAPVPATADPLLPETAPACACEHVPAPATKPTVSGRGLWVWRVRGPVADLVQRAKAANVSWVAVKAGNRGTPTANRDARGEWRNQFTPALVRAFHDSGILILGWGWDEPGYVARQVELARSVAAMGADGYIIDAEVLWDQGHRQTAARYVAALRAAVPPTFLIGDAPWDVREFHPGFPYAEFGAAADFRAPQVYWVAHGLSADRSWHRYLRSWGAEAQLPSGSAWGNATPADVALFEEHAKAAGMPGVTYWVQDSLPPAVAEWFGRNPW